jgi:hypothetical protein
MKYLSIALYYVAALYAVQLLVGLANLLLPKFGLPRWSVQWVFWPVVLFVARLLGRLGSLLEAVILYGVAFFAGSIFLYIHGGEDRFKEAFPSGWFHDAFVAAALLIGSIWYFATLRGCL